MPLYAPIEVIALSLVFSTILGFLWYGPLFGTAWMKHAGIKMPDSKPTFVMMAPSLSLSLLGTLFLSFTLMSMIEFHSAYFGVSGLGTNLSLAFFLWVGFIVPVHLNQIAWEQRSWTLFAINVGQWLVLMLGIALISSLFV